jgi:hypothetical protein
LGRSAGVLLQEIIRPAMTAARTTILKGLGRFRSINSMIVLAFAFIPVGYK